MRTETAHGFPSISMVDRCCWTIPKSDIAEPLTEGRTRRGNHPGPRITARAVQRMAHARNRPEEPAARPSPSPLPWTTPRELDRHGRARTAPGIPVERGREADRNPGPGFPRWTAAHARSRGTASG